MKNCHQCGSDMQDGDKFCMNCGSEYVTNVGAKAIVSSNPAIQQPPVGQTAVESMPPVVASQADPLSTPPSRPQRGSGLRTKLILGAILAIMLAAGGFWGWNTYGTEAQVEKKLDLAVKYLSDNNYEQAILAFNDAIKIDPKEVKGYQGLARTYSLQGNYDSAKETYEKGITAVITPQNKQILQLGLAGMYMDQNRLTDAEQAYSQIMNASPNCLEAYWGLAMVFNQQGNSSQAEAILRQAVEKNPKEYSGYNTLTLFLAQNNKPDEALNYIAQSLAMELNQQEAYLVLDAMYQNKWAELRSKTAGISDQTIASMLEFYSYYAAGDYTKAINTYQNKLSNQNGNQKAKILTAIAMVKNGDKTSAEAKIKQLNISKLNPWLLGDLGRYYLAAGDQLKAKEYALKALQAQPTDLEAIALLQAINANDPDAKIYSARALLFDWKPLTVLNQELRARQSSFPDSFVKTAGNSMGNTSINGAGNEIMWVAGDWIYYCNQDDGWKIYKMRTDGSKRQKLNDSRNGEIRVAGDWVHYVNGSDFGKIYRMLTDGSGQQKLNADDSRWINVAGDWVYYVNETDERKLYRIKTDGTGRQKLCDDYCSEINVSGDWIYYRTAIDIGNWMLYRIKTDGTGRQKLNIDGCMNINVVGNWVYYLDANGAGGPIHRVKIDGSERQELCDDICSEINVAGDWVYYIQWDRIGNSDGPLYRMKTDGSGRTRLNDDEASDINVAGDWIYYRNGDDSDKLFKIRTDGTERQVVN